MEIYYYKVPALKMKWYSFIVGRNILVKEMKYKNLKYIWNAKEEYKIELYIILLK